MVRGMKWHCPPDTRFEIRALAVWGRTRHLTVTEAPQNIQPLRVSGWETFCFLETWRPVQTQNICIAFVQHPPNVFAVGRTLYKCVCWGSHTRCYQGNPCVGAWSQKTILETRSRQASRVKKRSVCRYVNIFDRKIDCRWWSGHTCARTREAIIADSSYAFTDSDFIRQQPNSTKIAALVYCIPLELLVMLAFLPLLVFSGLDHEQQFYVGSKVADNQIIPPIKFGPNHLYICQDK